MGKFDDVRAVLRAMDFAFDRPDVRAAIRALEQYERYEKLIAAAGKVDREAVLGEFDNLVCSCHKGLKPGDDGFKPCFAGCVEGIQKVRALLESLPD